MDSAIEKSIFVIHGKKGISFKYYLVDYKCDLKSISPQKWCT